MKAIIVDDEPKAIELLKGYLEHFTGIELVQTFRNGLKAFEFLSQEQVDLVFLDINMPHISGISLSKIINPDTKIVFTTAHSQYAVESYEVTAVDYLLKPISLERFSKTMGKILLLNQKTNKISDFKFIFIKSGSKIFQVNPADIYYLEKAGNYITYYLKDEKILARATTQEALHDLPDFFIQTHKSFIVNLNRLSSIDKDSISVLKTSIPIGASFKEKLYQKLGI